MSNFSVSIHDPRGSEIRETEVLESAWEVTEDGKVTNTQLIEFDVREYEGKVGIAQLHRDGEEIAAVRFYKTASIAPDTTHVRISPGDIAFEL